MESLQAYLQDRIKLSKADFDLLAEVSVPLYLPAKTRFLEEGKSTDVLYFLSEGIVRGFKNKDGKLVVEHLVGPNQFITSMESFFQGIPSADTFETLSSCSLIRISKADLERLKRANPAWNQLIESIISESLQCKMERIHDFQTLTAKERYVKFVETNPDLALRVSIENIASFLGVEPPSLSRIRRQLSF